MNEGEEAVATATRKVLQRNGFETVPVPSREDGSISSSSLHLSFILLFIYPSRPFIPRTHPLGSPQLLS